MATSKVIELIVKAKDQASKTLDDISKNTEKLNNSLKEVRQISTVATTALVALWGVMVNDASKTEPVQKAFDWLAESIGENSKDMFKAINDASKWTVWSYELMLSANRAMKLGVAKNTDEMVDLMKIARLYWQQMGQDLESSFNDIVTGLWRGSAQILDNLWIVVDAGAVNEEYAKSLWKTVKELTDEEKKQALVNATIKEWKRALQEFWEPVMTVWEKMTALKNSFSSIGTSLWTALLPIVEKLVEKITPIFDEIVARIDANQELASTIFVTVTAITGIIAVLTGVMAVLPTIIAWITGLTWPIWLVIAWIVALWTAWATNFWGIRDITYEVIDEITAIVEPRIEEFKAFWSENGEEIKTILSWLWDAVKNIFSAAFQIIGEQLKFFFQALDVIFKLFKGDREGAWEGRKKMRVGVWETATNVVNTLFGWSVEYLSGLLDSLINVLSSVWEWFWNVWKQIKDSFIGAIDKAIWKVKELRDSVKNFGSWIWSSISSAWDSATSWVGGFFANGGHVQGNVPVVVWEKWPEIFVPQASWQIIPNNEIKGGGGDINISITWTTVNDQTDIDYLVDTLIRRIKLEKNFWIS